MVLLLTGCAVSVFNGYKATNGNLCRTADSLTWFPADTGRHLLFKTSIDLFSNHFSGLMVIKPLSGQHYRIIFVTEIGLKVFDLELSPNKGYVLHYGMVGFSRKSFLKILSNDMNLILMNGLDESQEKIFMDKSGVDQLIRYRTGRHRNYYWIGNEIMKPVRALQTSHMIRKVHARFYGDPATGLDSVKITHLHIPLLMKMSRIHDEQTTAVQ
jgi:hypothetical protein